MKGIAFCPKEEKKKKSVRTMVDAKCEALGSVIIARHGF
jgi:hypothetical protein